MAHGITWIDLQHASCGCFFSILCSFVVSEKAFLSASCLEDEWNVSQADTFVMQCAG